MAVFLFGNTTLKSLKSNDFMSVLDIAIHLLLQVVHSVGVYGNNVRSKKLLELVRFLVFERLPGRFFFGVIASLSSGAAIEIAIVARSAITV